MTKLQVTKASIYGKGGKLVPVGTVIDAKNIESGLESLASRTLDTSFVVATPEAATTAELHADGTISADKLADGAVSADEPQKVETLDRAQLEASAKTLGLKFTKSTTDEELLAAINESLGE